MRSHSLVLVAAGMLIAACGGSTGDTLTWSQFQKQAYQEAETGVYIVNGDEMAEDELQLRAAYGRYLETESDVGEARQNLIVNLANGQDDKWVGAAALNITYCIDQGSFGSRASSVINAMNSASANWEATARVNFVYASSQDATCTRRNNNVVFDIRQVCSGQYLARSFFPSSNRRNREILIDCTSFGNISPWSLTGVLNHELGHTIGFRHEHTRPEAGVCFEDNNWRALTAYDSSSVMHYPQCNGTNKGDLLLTSLDKTGAKALYP